MSRTKYKAGYLIAILSIFTIALFAQSSVIPPTDKVTEDSVTITKEKIYSDVKNALSQIGDALKVGAEHVYVILVKQQIVKSFVWLFVLILSIVCIYMVHRCWIRIEWGSYEIKDGSEIYMVGVIFFSVIAIGTLVGGLVNIETIITGFVNPEYGAIKEIMDIIN